MIKAEPGAQKYCRCVRRAQDQLKEAPKDDYSDNLSIKIVDNSQDYDPFNKVRIHEKETKNQKRI